MGLVGSSPDSTFEGVEVIIDSGDRYISSRSKLASRSGRAHKRQALYYSDPGSTTLSTRIGLRLERVLLRET